MTILAGDIKLVASQVMDDVPEGGGGPTSTIIADGVSNAIFPDISELDRAGGRVSLRKLHVSVQTANTDTYLGSNIIIAEPPQDPNVAVTLFSTDSVFDTRVNAASSIESYLIRGTQWSGFLLENHIVGQRVIQIFQSPNTAPVAVGRTLALIVNEGASNEVIQYVRVIRAEFVDSAYADPASTVGGTFAGRVVTCDISDALRYTFAGTSPNKTYLPDPNKAVIRDTTVADAGSYYGVVPLAVAAPLGATSVTCESVYTQLVPSAATEQIALDQYPSATRTVTLATTPRAVSVGAAPHSMRVKIGQENRGYSYVQILNPIPAPGTLQVSFLALGDWFALTDDGAGVLTGQGTGTVNYTNGTISVTLPSYPDAGSSLIYSWGEKIGYENNSGAVTFRPAEFSFDLQKLGVDPGSLTLTWYSGVTLKTATANAAGVLSGDATGSLAATLGKVVIQPNSTAMINPGGSFSASYTYSSTVTETKTGTTVSGGGIATLTTAQTPVAGSIVVEWLTTRTVSSSAGSQLNEGSATKSTDSSSSTTNHEEYSSKFVNYPNSPGWVAVTARNVAATVTKDVSGGTSSKLTVSSTKVSNTVTTVRHEIQENGAGGFLNSLGTINYAGKTITLKLVDPSTSTTSYRNDTESAADFGSATVNSSDDPGSTPSFWQPYVPAAGSSISGTSGGSTASQGGTYSTMGVSEVLDNSAIFVTYRTGTASGTSQTETFTPPSVYIDLAPYTTNRVVPGSVMFTWMGQVYTDNAANGFIYRGASASTIGTLSGTMDYSMGIANLTDYVVSGSSSSFTLNSLWTTKGPWTTSKLFFRTPTAPVKPSGLVLSLLDVAGNQIIGTANASGNIVGDHCLGTIDYQTGVVDIVFGDLILDSALTAAQKTEWWYAKALTQITAAGKVWRPWPVDPYSLRYNVVTYFYLPLDADILGIDPVRLPQDGRVTIFRNGGFAVVGNTQSSTQTVTNAQVVNTGRVRLSRVKVTGQTGATITTGYTTDLEAGTVTFTSVAGYSQPVTIENRIEDLVQVSDVQITGKLNFTRAITHAYPADTSYVSSALVSADLRARVSVLFDQATWNGISWLDYVSGDPATGTYNTTLAPLLVTNIGATTERWALRFTSSTAFQVIGEHVGVIATGTINTNVTPVNPATGEVYFTLLATGWGVGWATGNVLRFNTVGAMAPIWLVRTVQQGPETVTDDSFKILVRGDVDQP